MNNTEKQLIEILSAFVNRREPEIKMSCDLTELYELSAKQQVAGIVGYMLTTYNKTKDERFKNIFYNTVSYLVRKETCAQNLLEKFNEEKVPHIIFKGLVIKDSYPVPELRTYGDIDIIIPDTFRKKSHKLMIDMGYKWELMDNGDVYAYQKGIEYYELHTTLNSSRLKLSNYMSNFWDHTVERKGFTREFEHEFHFCYLISHIEKHVYGSGAGVRMYLDIALFLKKYGKELNFEKIREILRECELEKFFDSLLFICSRWFQCEFKPREDMKEEVYNEYCRYTFKGGVFGLQEKESCSENEVRQSINRKGKASKFSVIMHHLFPPYKEVRRMYPFFNGKPYLLPAGWVVHFIKASRRSGLKHIKMIASVDVSAAQNDKELLDNIGSRR